MSDKIFSTVYRSEKKAGAYLFTTMDQGLEPVPELLLHQLGELSEAMTLTLEPTRKLANADTQKVMAALNEQGYYLQMPPGQAAQVEATLAGIAASSASRSTNTKQQSDN